MKFETVFELSDLSAEGLARIPLMKLGRYAKRIGGKLVKFAITAATAASAVANFRKRKADVVIDYDHGSAAPTGDLVPAAGWLKAVDDAPDSDGVLWGSAEFTAKARTAIEAKELKYISPELVLNSLDKTTGEPAGAEIAAVAATNRPFLDGMPAIALNDLEWDKFDRGDADEKEKKIVKVILADRVARTVRLVNDDGAESVLVVEGLEVAPKVVRLSDLTAGSDGQYDFAQVQCGDGVLIAGDVFRARLAQDALNGAIAAGKILPAQRKFYGALALNDLAGFEAFVKDAPKVVNLTEQGTGSTVNMSEADIVDAEIHQKVREKMAALKLSDYGDAAEIVLRENPELARRKKKAVAR